MEELTKLQEQLIEFLPNLLGALGILVGGWIVAVILGRIVQALLDRTTLDEKAGKFLGGEGKKAPAVDRWISGAVRWLVLLYTLVLVFTALELGPAIQPLNDALGSILDYLPKLAIGIGLLFVAWAIATGLRYVVVTLLAAVKFDQRVSAAATEDEEASGGTVSNAIGTAVYWIVWFVFILILVEVLELEGLLEPLKGMANEVFAFVPNLISAAVILLVGWLIATVIRRVSGAALRSVGVDSLADRTGLSKVGKGSISELLATVVFLLVLLPMLAMALDALELEAVSKPVSGLLDTFFQAIPKLLVAALILGVAFVLGRLLGSLVSDLLARLGFDDLVGRLGLSANTDEDTPESRRPSSIVGMLTTWAVLLFALMEAADVLELGYVSDALDTFLAIAGGWLLGLVIFGLGLWLARVVSGVIRDQGTPSSGLLATVARIAISVLAAIAALNHMDIAADVVTWGSIALIGSAGLAAALAFGLGGREAAAEELRRWRAARDELRSGLPAPEAEEGE